MAYPNIYASLTRQLTEEGKVQLDALLGLEGADEAMAELRQEAITAAGFEVA